MVAAVILAAGASTRLGRPKQMLEQGGRTLLRHVVETAGAAGCQPVIVVLGSRAAVLAHSLDGVAVRIVHNRRWREGLGSSVRTGVVELQRRWPAARGVLMLTCDQPHISANVVRRLCASFDGSPERIVASAYAGTLGVPVLFGRALFGELGGLSGAQGARSVLRAHAADVVSVSWPEGAIDIDHPEDCARLE